jgi:hypothetical protein
MAIAAFIIVGLLLISSTVIASMLISAADGAPRAAIGERRTSPPSGRVRRPAENEACARG